MIPTKPWIVVAGCPGVPAHDEISFVRHVADGDEDWFTGWFSRGQRLLVFGLGERYTYH